MVLKLELNRCADLARTTYQNIMKTKLFKITNYPLGENWPNLLERIYNAFVLRFVFRQ